LSFLHIALVEELFEQQVGPLNTQIELSQAGGDIASMKDNRGDQLLGLLNGSFVRKVYQLVYIFVIFDFELVQMILEFFS
jgi:hypothetical protein